MKAEHLPITLISDGAAKTCHPQCILTMSETALQKVAVVVAQLHCG